MKDANKTNCLLCLFNDFYSSVFDLFYGWIIRNLYFCSLVFTLLCLIYMMGGKLENYLFFSIFNPLSLIYLMGGTLEIYLFVYWFLLLCDINLSACSLVFNLP